MADYRVPSFEEWTLKKQYNEKVDRLINEKSLFRGWKIKPPPADYSPEGISNLLKKWDELWEMQEALSRDPYRK